MDYFILSKTLVVYFLTVYFFNKFEIVIMLRYFSLLKIKKKKNFRNEAITYNL